MSSPFDPSDASDPTDTGAPAAAPASPRVVGVPDGAKRAATVLHRVFGFDSFRGRQEEIIGHVIGGGDALVLMPTGGGKSLCYQIPALVRPGTGVVISPLIALMQDQVQALRQLGIRADFLNSTQDPGTRHVVEQQFKAGELDLLYLAPGAAAAPRPRCGCSTPPRSRCSPSTRRTACRSGATTSGPTTWSSRCCTSAGRTCRGSR